MNAFDELNPDRVTPEQRKAIIEQEKEHERRKILLHKVFEQNKDGKELFRIWEDGLIMVPGCGHGMDAYDVGIIEGRKQAVREIRNAINEIKGNK